MPTVSVVTGATSGIAHATDPFEVAAVIHEAVTADQPRLRYPCSWGGPEIIAGRQRLDDEYDKRFEGAFGVDVRPPA